MNSAQNQGLWAPFERLTPNYRTKDDIKAFAMYVFDT